MKANLPFAIWSFYQIKNELYNNPDRSKTEVKQVLYNTAKIREEIRLHWQSTCLALEYLKDNPDRHHEADLMNSKTKLESELLQADRDQELALQDYFSKCFSH